jgi:hypothetical protein
MGSYDHCANPACPRRNKLSLDSGLGKRWVQVEELETHTAGHEQPVVTVRRRFAGVCCSRRCAAEYLMANLADEDERQAAEARLLSDFASTSSQEGS